MAKFEGYYDDAKPEFEALEKKLKHNLAKDLEFNRKTLKQVLSADLVRVYYYQRGGIENSLQWDKQWQAATKLLLNEDEYNKVLAPTIAKQTTESHK